MPDPHYEMLFFTSKKTMRIRVYLAHTLPSLFHRLISSPLATNIHKAITQFYKHNKSHIKYIKRLTNKTSLLQT